MQILSIQGQLHELARFAERAGLEVVDQLTEACSAREPGRPVFSKLLNDIEHGRVDRILSWKLDRLARNPVDGGALIHALGKGKLKEIVTPEGTYNGSGDSKFMLAIQFGAATKMTDDLSVGVKRGCRELVEEGRLPGAPPLGYIKIREGMGFKAGAGKVVPDPERFPLVRAFFHDLLSGAATVTSAWERARAAGLTTRPTMQKPSHPVALNGMFDLVRNPFYAGFIRYDGETYPGAHEAMITPTQFKEIQRLAARADAPRPAKHVFAFTGLLHCGDCGGTRAMVAEAHVKPTGRRFVYYRCARRRKGREVCRAKAVTEPTVMAAAAAGLAAITIPERVRRWTLDALEWWERERSGEGEAEAAAVARRTRDLEGRLRRLTDALLDGVLTREEYAARKQELQLELAELRERPLSRGACDDAWRATVEDIVNTGTVTVGRFAEATPEEQQRILATVYANSSVSAGIVRFSLKNPYTVLRSAPFVSATVPARYANFPRPADVCQPRKKAARSSKIETAFRTWWTRLCDVRTGLQRDPTGTDEDSHVLP